MATTSSAVQSIGPATKPTPKSAPNPHANTHQFINKNALIIVLIFTALATSVVLIQQKWHDDWATLLNFIHYDTLPLDKMATALALVPTMLVAVLAGGILGTASVLLQVLAKNPLASDSTLAVSAGAQMALLIATLFLPALGLYGSFWVAFLGACASIGVVFLLAAKSAMNPVAMVLSGLIVNILLGSIAAVLLLFNSELSLGVMVWGSGILTQTGFATSYKLVWAAAGLFLGILPIYKMLGLMSLDDSTAKSLGVPINWVRTYVVGAVAVALGVVVAELGLIGFVGLSAATLANLSAKTLWQKLFLSFIAGACVLLITSNVLILAGYEFVGAGAMTAILGAPLLIYLILSHKKTVDDVPILATPNRTKPPTLFLFITLLLLTFAALFFTKQVQNTGGQLQLVWQFSWHSDLGIELITRFRLPRTVTAMAAGIMLAVSGAMLQTLTKNPLASPEVLGISAACALGVVTGFVLAPVLGLPNGQLSLFLFGASFAIIALFLVLWLAKRVASGYLLLAGIAVGALSGGVLTLIKASGDPRIYAVLNFLAGSTYYATPATAAVYAAIAITGLIIVLLLTKSLAIMGFGPTISQSLGVRFVSVQWAVLSLIALFSTAATFAVGALSFVGLMIPHLALLLGAINLHARILLSAVLGAMMMLIADWLGRYLIFPYEIPAGTLASLIGGVYFVWLMGKLTR